MTPLEWAWMIAGALALIVMGMMFAIWRAARLIRKVWHEVMGRDWP